MNALTVRAAGISDGLAHPGCGVTLVCVPMEPRAGWCSINASHTTEDPPDHRSERAAEEIEEHRIGRFPLANLPGGLSMMNLGFAHSCLHPHRCYQ